MMIATSSKRAGFLTADCVIALAIITVAVVGVSQLTVLAQTEFARGEQKLEALEAATNILEAARSREWKDLTPEWASQQKLQEQLTSRSETMKLTVTVTPESGRPRVKRVVIRIDRSDSSGRPIPPIVDVALFAAREKEGS